jgi:hypothetical protein
VLEQQVDAGAQRCLGQLDGAHVVLGDGETHTVRLVHDVAEGAAVLDDAIGALGEVALHDAVGVDDAGQIHLADHLDDARPADARDVERLRALLEAGLVAPQVATDDLEPCDQRLAVDADPLDGTCRRALPAAQLGALERRSRGAAGGELACAVADDDLGVGAHVHQQLHGGGAMRAFGEDDRRSVCTDVARNARCQVHLRVSARQLERRCRHGDGLGGACVWQAHPGRRGVHGQRRRALALASGPVEGPR